jgi:transcriptional regulator with XRE-family HTH domain
VKTYKQSPHRALAHALKRARQDKGLSQRELGTRVGVPQSHISRTESGAVDLQTSSLIEYARALDFEVMLVPRVLVPAVEALSRRIRNAATQGGSDASLRAIPAYRLSDGEDDV